MLRFHLFNQADELGKIPKNNIQLYTSWPRRTAVTKHSLKHININGYWFFGLLLFLSQKIPLRLLNSYLLKFINYTFARYAFKSLPTNAEKIIFCSTHLYPNLDIINRCNAEIITDHGSLHPVYEMNLMKIENEKYNFEISGNESKPWIQSWLIKEFDVSDKIFVCSDLARDTFIEHGVKPEKIYTNKLGVNLSQFISNEKRDYNIKKESVNILCVGAVIPRKGIHRLIDSLINIKDYDFKLTCVGTLPKDNSLRKILKKSYDNILINMVGAVDQSELRKFYLDSNIFILPSICDGFGMVTTQAMASKAVCLISNYAGSKELIDNGNNGFIIPDVKNKRDFADILLKILKLSPSEREKIANNAHETVTNLSGWSDYGLSVYNNLLKNGR